MSCEATIMAEVQDCVSAKQAFPSGIFTRIGLPHPGMRLSSGGSPRFDCTPWSFGKCKIERGCVVCAGYSCASLFFKSLSGGVVISYVPNVGGDGDPIVCAALGGVMLCKIYNNYLFVILFAFIDTLTSVQRLHCGFPHDRVTGG